MNNFVEAGYGLHQLSTSFIVAMFCLNLCVCTCESTVKPALNDHYGPIKRGLCIEVVPLKGVKLKEILPFRHDQGHD